MRLKSIFVMALMSLVCTGLLVGTSYAADFKIAIMQDQAGAARKFKPLLDYLESKGVKADFVAARDYPTAAQMFARGDVDAMFSGSGIAGTMIIKDLAYPVVRPVSKDGTSTYWAVVLAPKGSSRFDGKADYFRNKKVTFSSLASSGEFFFRSIPGAANVGATQMKAASHGAAIDVLERGRADIAIVKNRVWDKVKGKYRNVELVGEDHGENPNGTLIASKKASKSTVEKVSDILMGLEDDNSAQAKAAKDSLGIQGYTKTTEEDFSHTLKLLKSAGVTKDFNFSF